MQRIVINDASQLELLRKHHRVEVCDSEGVTIGVFLSLEDQDPKLYDWATSQLTDDELECRKRNREEGRTTADVLKRLEAQ